ncbi:hypothetical protein M427DRAFT_367643 [Gonapodya prolifera JEL478]|uniref:Uncharacterized protein n=1 Tax=Gonapodya prolifera (strain JEL478) TaxID=1344416 RepID=A0A139A9J5_GONPJ|nr:hypothetical protein M427DRAFT_367643 [Gonapodya prolifera JEL478]|eukprot:KXS13470.1 hypothetical protein M427DRAFT_367643 [Gonapodya prolifera JEL478]
MPVYYNHINPDLPLFWRVLLSPFCGFPYGSLLGAPVVIYFARLFFSDILPPHMIPATNPSLLPNLPVLLTTIFLVAYSEIPFLLAIAKAIFGPYHEMFLHPANGFPLGSTVGVWVFTALARPLFEQALGKKADGTLAAANKAAREGLTEMLSVYIVSCATGSYFSANFPLPFVQRILLHPLLSFPYGSLLLTPTINRFARVFFPLVLPFDTVPKEDPGLFPHIPIALATYILLLVPEVPLLKSAGALVFGSYDWLILDPGNGYVIGFTVGVWISVWLARRLLIAPTFKTAERAEEPSIRVAKLSSDRATNGAGPQKRRPFEADSDQGPGEKVPLFAFPTAPSEGTQSSKSAQSKPGKSGKKGKR